MIIQIHGKLESIDDNAAAISMVSGLTYQVLVPAYLAARLQLDVGEELTLHTIQYLEGSSQGTSFIPRLAGFTRVEDRGFFDLFTTVKGIGTRKALRAMAMEPAIIADAIADRDVKMLQSLPEIGRRTAETIIASLHGKVDEFVSGNAYGSAADSQEGAEATPQPGRAAAREALEVLLQLGENRASAIKWIDEAVTRNPDVDDPQVLITEVLRVKAMA